MRCKFLNLLSIQQDIFQATICFINSILIKKNSLMPKKVGTRNKICIDVTSCPKLILNPKFLKKKPNRSVKSPDNNQVLW